MRLHFLYRLILIAVLITVSGFVENNYAITREENLIIYPGKGVGLVRINEPAPAGLPSFVQTTIKTNKVEKIIITSDRFFVAVSALRVRQNNKGDILRFYGNNYTHDENNENTLKYDSQGIAFEIDRFSERITAIIIYMPVEKLYDESEYKQYRDQFKQKSSKY